MKFFKKFFQPKWQSNDDNIRSQAISDFADNAPELIDIAKNDSNALIRATALDKITDISTIIELRNDSRLGANMTDKLIQLLNNKDINLSTLSNLGSHEQMGLVFSSQRQDLQTDFLNSINDQTQLLELVKHSPSAKVRAAAAEKIHDQATLVELVNYLKGKDKNTWRNSKARLDTLNEQQKLISEQNAATQHLVDSALKLKTRGIDANYPIQLKGLMEQWLHIEAPNKSELTPDFNQAVQAAQQRIDDIENQAKAELEAAQAKEQAKNEAHRQSLLLPQKVQALCVQLLDDNTEKTDIETLTASLSTLTEQWNALSDHPSSQRTWIQNTQRFEQLSQWFMQAKEQNITLDDLNEAQINALFNAANWPKNEEMPPLLTRFKAQLNTWQSEQKAQQDEQYQAVGAIFGMIKKIKRHIENGEIRRSFSTWRALEEKIEKIEKMPTKLERELEILSEDIQKLQDWHHYATLPKKQELVEKMQAMVDKDIDPETKASKIKALQIEWKDISKGGKDQEPELWQAFQEAGDKAFAPCKIWFAAQADARAARLTRRLALIDELHQFYNNIDWQSDTKPDWAQIKQALKLARNEWRTLEPVERQAHHDSLAKFNQAMDLLQEKINAENQHRCDEKQALIIKANDLLSQDNAKQAADNAKLLQAQWKSIGFGDRKTEDALWTEFRNVCDKIFAHRETERESFINQLETNGLEAKRLIDELQQLATTSIEEAINLADVQRLKEAFDDLGQFPKAEKNKLFNQFKQLQDQIKTNLAQQEVNAEAKKWQDLFDWNNQVAQLENDKVSSVELPVLPKSPINKDVLKQRIEVFGSEGNQTLLRELCIQMEILADTETPAEDQQLRMDMQVKRLSQGIGAESEQHKEKTLTHLIESWFAQPAIELELYKTLFDRFWATRNKIIG